MDLALPMNSGAEAVETALKAARKWAYTIKGVPFDQAEIIAADGNFHGRTIAITGFSSVPQYRDGFGPFRPASGSFHSVTQQHWRLRSRRTRRPSWSSRFKVKAASSCRRRATLAEVAHICRAHRVLLLCDEIQSGLGRTGRLLACEHDGVKPDGLMLGKALGGGLLPVSLFLARREVMEVFNPGDHGSTFGGNPIAAAVGLAALDTLIDEGLIERAAVVGAHLLDRLASIKSPIIREVRGRGSGSPALSCIATSPVPKLVALRLLRAGVLTKDTHRNTIRFAPPLIIEEAQVDWAVERLADVLRTSPRRAPQSGNRRRPRAHPTSNLTP